MTKDADRRLTRRATLAGAAALLAACSQATSSAPLPRVTIPPLKGLMRASGWPVPGIDPDTFLGGVTVLNVWASWCPYCRGEHGILKKLANDARFKLVGLVHRDSPEAALDYLRRAGNPFHAIAVDERGALTRPLGQRGVPNSYVIDRAGRVAARVPGALSDHSLERIVFPAVVAALARPAQA